MSASTKFKFDLQVFGPFNFHRVVRVRKTYNILVTKFLEMTHEFFTFKELLTLHTLTVQAIIMEEDEGLREILL